MRSLSLPITSKRHVNFDESTASCGKWKVGSGIELSYSVAYLDLPSATAYIARLERKNHNDVVTVLLPEFVPARWWQHLLHNQSSLMLKGALLFKKGVIVISVPYHLES